MPLEIADQAQFDENVGRLDALLADREVRDLDEREFKLLLRAKISLVRTGLSINLPVYRARFPGPLKDLDRISSFSYPRPKDYKGGGRCHVPGKPVFYGASDSDTAIKEALRTTGSERDGEIGYISRWQALEPLNYLDFIYADSDLKSKLAKSLTSYSQSRLRSNLSIYSGTNVTKLPTLAEKIGRAFLSEDHNRSSRLCHSILYNQGAQLREHAPIHGVIYPSVIKDHGGFNYAITPYALSRFFAPLGIWRIKVNKNQKNGVFIELDQFGIPNRGRIMWYDVKPIVTFDNILSLAVAGEGHMPIQVSLEAPISTSAGETTIGAFVRTGWYELAKEFYNIGTIDEDILPGVRLVRQKYINLNSPHSIKTQWGEVLATSIMVVIAIPFAFEPVSSTDGT